MIYLNGRKLDFETFPNGETLVNGKQIKENIDEFNVVTLKYENDSDLVKLMFVKKHIDRFAGIKFMLQILYMPYSRMDRVEGDSVFTLKYVSEFINSLKFDSVEVIEPHSDVSMALLDNSFATYFTVDYLADVLRAMNFDKNVDYLFFPDAGAAKRYSKIIGLNTAVGYKTRDFTTGKITSFQVIGGEQIAGKKVLILDDLCSYGGTFMLSGTELKKLGAQEIYLFVAHAEESIFKGDLLLSNSPIDKVFASDSIINDNIDSNKLHVFNII